MGGGGGVLAGLHIVLWPFPHSSVLIKRAKDRGMVSQAPFRSSGAPLGQASRWHTCCIEHGIDPESAVLQLWLRSTAPWKLGACAWSSSEGFDFGFDLDFDGPPVPRCCCLLLLQAWAACPDDSCQHMEASLV